MRNFNSKIFYILGLTLTISISLVSCVKDSEEIKVNQSSNLTIPTGVLEVHYGLNENHSIVAVNGTDTIIKNSPMGNLVDTMQLSPGNYDVLVYLQLNQQSQVQGTFEDFTITITAGNTTVIAVPF